MSDVVTEVSAILAAGGFSPMPAGEMKGLLCKECAGGWWMGGVHETGAHSKHTLMSPDTTYDPIQAAHELVARVSPRKTLEEIGRAYSDASDLAMYGEAAEDAGHDAHGEAVEQMAQAAGPSDEGGSDDHQRGDSGNLYFAELDGSENEGGDQGGLGAEILDADYETESPDLGAEILLDDYGDGADPLLTYTEAEGEEAIAEPEHAAGAFIFGDNLHQMRTAAIGLVVQAALERMPDSIDYARMSELRNFTMGVSEGRWPDDPAKREELDTLEATERLRRAIEAARDAKVAALLGASREEIEAFDVDAGWP